ncbi:ornithine cyclodeaminase [Pseudomonas gingeri]|uniref:Ornithine cyclodeaminase n=1 Tax=Pseudomonas gingeri TaxID=117681 RepID=A0A7Y7YG16_9PSED|nr:ornithine cyclodeaminase [Pseudomonas gingeri]NVZ99246.1 ornithine cyclodeaminase [Pseudomonas gingeri]NWA13291.1 ornithine cyclodeaminase [Pseudomonas gingeri]NWA55552.1 ornithine cyclodeaminase [Pseudomonas gingeri]NWA95594.1 ornithine cyclodeaminase [Pseudomonas gingeri]NWB00681.1 ornithine cyclodeaminase [Pseudomonas gingeri]
MTLFIDVDHAARLFATVGIRRAIREMAAYIEADYARWAQFDKSPRTANHSVNGVIELMPTDDGQQYSFKYVNGHPDNGQSHLLTVMAFGVLADVHSGYPTLLSELTLTTAVRTAATSALVAQSLARPDASVMAIIGNGAQSEFQALAFHEMLSIQEIRLFDIDRDASLKLKHNLSAFPAIKVILANSVQEAVKGAHIVTTVTADKAHATILMPEMIEPGMHINAVGGDCPGKTELHADILRNARVIVEFEAQTRIEGDIQQLAADFPVVEFFRIVQGEVPGRENDAQVTVFDSVGFALEDFSSLRYMHDLAREHAIGERIHLVPTPANIKNLYQLLDQPVATSRLRTVG